METTRRDFLVRALLLGGSLALSPAPLHMRSWKKKANLPRGSSKLTAFLSVANYVPGNVG